MNEDRSREALEHLVVHEPPADFADRVLAGAEQGSSEPKGPRRSRALGVAAAVVAVGAAAMAWHASRGVPAPIRGSAAPETRAHLSLGRRGVAVAEAGAELDWLVSGSGAVEVEQRRGDVFYRVDRGGTFTVDTPRGRVSVTGTCFRVETQSMKPSKQALAGAAVGAAIATTVFVTVYEGRILWAADRGGDPVPVNEGQRIRIDDRGAEVMEADESGGRVVVELGDPPESATRDELLARDRAQRAEIARLHRQLGKAGGHGSRGPAAVDPDGRPWFDPSPSTLEAFAAECRVRYDVPPLEMPPGAMNLDPEVARRLNLTDDEIKRMAAAVGSMSEALGAEVRELYLEATGDVDGAETLSVQAMGQEIANKSAPGEGPRAQQVISRERAGIAEPPADPRSRSPLERYYRLLSQIGDATEDAVAQVVGRERARAIRSEMDGWGWHMEMAGCPGDEESVDADERR